MCVTRLIVINAYWLYVLSRVLRAPIQSRDRTHSYANLTRRACTDSRELHSFLIDRTAAMRTAAVVRGCVARDMPFRFFLLSRKGNNTILSLFLAHAPLFRVSLCFAPSGAICSGISSDRSHFNLRPVSQEIWLLGRKRKRRRRLLPPPFHPSRQFALPF